MDGTLRHIRTVLRRRALWLVCLSALGSLPKPVSAQTPPYIFTRIADTEHDDPGVAGLYCLGMNNRGNVIVVFAPNLSGFLQIWRGDGQSFIQVAPEVANFCPSINDLDETAYIVPLDPSGHVALVRNTNGTLTTLATSIGLLDGSSNSAYTPLNNNGSVAFVTRPGVSGAGIRIEPAGLWAYDPATDPQLLAFAGPASINDANTVVFGGIRADNAAPFGSRVGIYRGSSVPLVEEGDLTSAGTIAMGGAFSGTRPVINNAGTVAFVGATAGVPNVYTTLNGVALTLVGTGVIDRIAINNEGAVAFRRHLGGQSEGIFVGRPGAIDGKVIEVGDPLDGSIYQGGFVWEQSINDKGQVAFFAFLSDGRQGVYRADPVETADTTAPIISGVPGTIVAEATSGAGAAVNYPTPTANDETDGTVGVTCSPPSGVNFALGTTTVNCRASDAAGNPATASFSVLVRDTTPPVIGGVPGPITVTATDVAGASVSYGGLAAVDLVSGTVAVICAPLAGTTFPIGSTTVSCTARDSAQNQSSAGFVVTVLPPPLRRLSGSGYNFPETPSYRATFSVDARGPFPSSGSIQYVYTRTRMTFVSTSITGFVPNGSRVILNGTGTVNGASGYTFSVSASDGAPDTFTITIVRPDGSMLYSASGTLAGGALTLSP